VVEAARAVLTIAELLAQQILEAVVVAVLFNPTHLIGLAALVALAL